MGCHLGRFVVGGGGPCRDRRTGRIPFPNATGAFAHADVASARGRTCIQFDLESGKSPASSREAIDALRFLNEKHVESTILKFNVAIAESGAAMTDIETCLRSLEEGQEAATIEACLAELVKDSENYLVEQGRLGQQFSQRMGELGDMAGVGEEVEMANLDSAAQLETTISNLKHMDFHSDLSAARARLLEELGNLRRPGTIFAIARTMRFWRWRGGTVASAKSIPASVATP